MKRILVFWRALAHLFMEKKPRCYLQDDIFEALNYRGG